MIVSSQKNPAEASQSALRQHRPTCACNTGSKIVAAFDKQLEQGDMGMGTALYDLGRKYDGVELDIDLPSDMPQSDT